MLFEDQLIFSLLSPRERVKKVYSVRNHARIMKPLAFLFHTSILFVKLFCDVNNPLYGPSGAAFTYSKQKGATPEEIVLLDKGLKQFAQLILNITGKDINAIPGAGAAGGVPAGLAAFLNSEIVSGTQELIQLTGLENKLTNSDIIISGEGCVDEQSTMGKVVHGVQSLCVKHNKPLYLFAGISRLEGNSFIDSNRIYTTSAFASSAQESIVNAEKFLKMARARGFLARIIFLNAC